MKRIRLNAASFRRTIENLKARTLIEKKSEELKEIRKKSKKVKGIQN